MPQITHWSPKELETYNQWHQVLDYFCWLIKICYSSKEDIKKKNFKLDVLFANYLKATNSTKRKITQNFPVTGTKQKKFVATDLMRGWYNEISYCSPLKPSTLGLTSIDIDINIEDSKQRFLFPSWKITNAYYSIYFYLRGISYLKFPNFRPEQHKSAINAFNNNAFSPLTQTLLKFPFDIHYLPKKRLDRKNLLISKIPHLNFKYCSHPRYPNESPMEVFEYVLKIFKKQSGWNQTKKITMYSIFDYFYDLRVWANYIDIDNLVKLWGPGYKVYLDQNLSTILFFIGGISDACFIFSAGEKEYLKQLQKFYDIFAKNNSDINSKLNLFSPFQRFHIFKTLGMVKGKLNIDSEKPLNVLLDSY